MNTQITAPKFAPNATDFSSLKVCTNDGHREGNCQHIRIFNFGRHLDLPPVTEDDYDELIPETGNDKTGELGDYVGPLHPGTPVTYTDAHGATWTYDELRIPRLNETTGEWSETPIRDTNGLIIFGLIDVR